MDSSQQHQQLQQKKEKEKVMNNTFSFFLQKGTHENYESVNEKERW